MKKRQILQDVKYIRLQKILKSLLVLLIIEYVKKKYITNFNISSCPAFKTTHQGIKTNGILCLVA